MRSVVPESTERTAKERILAAAIDCIAEAGATETTARRVAAAAGVSAGLVMHHFGSMEGLRNACDEEVAATIRELKTDAIATGASFDPLEALRRQSEGPNIARYLARTLVDGSPQVGALVDELVADAVGYMETGVTAGMIRPTTHPRERAAILTVWALGALVLHEHLERLIGVDITEPVGDDPRAASSYLAPLLDILGRGLISEEVVDSMRSAFVEPSTDQEKGTP